MKTDRSKIEKIFFWCSLIFFIIAYSLEYETIFSSVIERIFSSFPLLITIVIFAFEGIALAMFAFCFIGPNNKIKINVLTILDALLCYVLICFYPYPVSILLFNYNREIYYLLGIIFSALPFISDMFSNINISFSTIRRILTRALMVLTMIVICLSMLSCSPNIG